MIKTGQYIQIRTNPFLADWTIGCVAFIEPFDDGYVHCDYWVDGQREVFKFMLHGCEWDNMVLIEGFSCWKKPEEK